MTTAEPASVVVRYVEAVRFWNGHGMVPGD